MGKLLQPLIALGTPRRFYHLCDTLVPWWILFSAPTLAYGLISGFFWAPPDTVQGEGYRIIYVHVPCAMLSMFIYSGIAVLSAIYLIWRIKLADIIAIAIAPLGALMTVLALITGSIWGKPMWGTWWIWDARLTSELILLFLYIGYIALYRNIPNPLIRSKSAAILAIVGAVDIPIIHYSVTWWNTLHQGSTLGWGKLHIAPEMFYPLLSMLLGFSFFMALVGCIRVKTEIIKRNQDKQWVKVMVMRWIS